MWGEGGRDSSLTGGLEIFHKKKGLDKKGVSEKKLGEFVTLKETMILAIIITDMSVQRILIWQSN